MINHYPLVSIIIPVYNIKSYLCQCINSVIKQSYYNIEIILIDDGSFDGSSEICDKYARIDDRIKVFHTTNNGLSAARNLGIEKASGEYIAFLDGDDWLSLNAIKKLLIVSLKNNADIVCCCFSSEYKNIISKNKKNINYTIKLYNEDIIKKYILGLYIENVSWNKLYKRELFSNIRFPIGRNYEDIATTYKLLLASKLVICIPDILIHYRIRKNSISNSHDYKTLRDYWWATYTRYRELSKMYYDNQVMLISCIKAIGRMWRWYSYFSKEEQEKARPLLIQMQKFVKLHFDEIKGINKIWCIISRFNNPIYMRFIYFVNQIFRRIDFIYSFLE